MSRRIELHWSQAPFGDAFKFWIDTTSCSHTVVFALATSGADEATIHATSSEDGKKLLKKFVDIGQQVCRARHAQRDIVDYKSFILLTKLRGEKLWIDTQAGKK